MDVQDILEGGIAKVHEALQAGLRAEAKAYQALGGKGLEPELVTDWVKGNLTEDARKLMEELAQGNPIIRLQLIEANAGHIDPPEPTPSEVLRVARGVAPDEVMARFERWAGSGRNRIKAAEHYLADFERLTVPVDLRPAAPGAAPGGRGGGGGEALEGLTSESGVQFRLGSSAEAVRLEVWAADPDLDNLPLGLLLEGETGRRAADLVMKLPPDGGLAGTFSLGSLAELEAELGTAQPQVTVLVPY